MIGISFGTGLGYFIKVRMFHFKEVVCCMLGKDRA